MQALAELQATDRRSTLRETVQDLCARNGGEVNVYRLINPKRNRVEVVVYHETIVKRIIEGLVTAIKPRQTRKTVLSLPLSDELVVEKVELVEGIVRDLIQEFRPEHPNALVRRLHWEGCGPHLGPGGRVAKYGDGAEGSAQW